jgi:hypothetical protein
MALTSWCAAFVVTALVEVPIVVAALPAVRAPAWRRSAVALAAQFVTHPVVWFLFPQIGALSPGEALWLSELWAWLVEAILFALALPGVPFLRAVGASALANGASLGVGCLIGALIEASG